MTAPASPNSLVLSYLTLRKAIGAIGTALPFVLAFGGMMLGATALEPSMSAYYHTPMRDVFVGSLCAIGVFLWSYCGYDWKDNRAGNLACMFAIGVALFPTTPAGATAVREVMLGRLHLASATGFFLTLAYFSLVLFTKTDERNPTPRKIQRNRVYRVCGYAILACLAAIAVLKLLPATLELDRFAPVFWLEAGAIVAFGVSWLTKGEAILKDETAPVRAAEPAREVARSSAR